MHNFKLCNIFALFDNNLGFWVKPWNTTWFSKFLLEQVDGFCLLEMFRMTKSAVYALANLLRPHVQKHDTKYRMVVPILVCVTCTLFKLTHGVSLCICSKMFAVGRSIVSLILQKVVCAITTLCVMNSCGQWGSALVRCKLTSSISVDFLLWWGRSMALIFQFQSPSLGQQIISTLRLEAIS